MSKRQNVVRARQSESERVRVSQTDQSESSEHQSVSHCHESLSMNHYESEYESVWVRLSQIESQLVRVRIYQNESGSHNESERVVNQAESVCIILSQNESN